MKREYISPVVNIVVVRIDHLMLVVSETTQDNNAAWGREDDSFWDDEE
jgi:hypothetical protein